MMNTRKALKAALAKAKGTGNSATTEGDIVSEGPSDPDAIVKRARQKKILGEAARSSAAKFRVGPAKKSL